jgi:23S rRNA (uracil1939-C5)-methyltransferase
MRARLHVRDGRIGFMREGSHQLCPAGPSGQLLPATVAWIDAAAERIQRDRLTGLSSIEIAENIPALERACHLELEPGASAAPFAALAMEGVTGLSAQVADRRAVEPLSGVAVVTDVLQLTPDDGAAAPGAGATLHLQRDARAFFQGNRFLLEPFVRHVTALVPEGPVIDLYAGVGLFGLWLAAAGAADVRLVEGDPVAAHDLKENARPYAGRARVHRASVEAFLQEMDAVSRASGAATFLVDPPRTGLSKEAIAPLLRLTPKRIVYVSCDVATLARDARTLLDAGYELEGMRGFDLFPNTAHVETVCAFSL